MGNNKQLMKLIKHSERFVMVDKFPNEFFEKHWDDLNKKEYFIIKDKKYYISYPINLCKLEEAS